MTNETRSADCFGDISCLMQNAHQLRFVIQDRNGHRLPIALEKPAIGTPQVIALCFHSMLAPSLCRDADGIKQACDAGCILKIRIIRKDVKGPFSGHSAALGIGDGSMRIVDVEDSHPRSEEHTSALKSIMRISYAFFC